MIFHRSIPTEKLMYKMLNALPNNDIVRGGGSSAYRNEFTVNHINVGMSEYENVRINDRTVTSFL
jgi:hypothetical protein